MGRLGRVGRLERRGNQADAERQRERLGTPQGAWELAVRKALSLDNATAEEREQLKRLLDNLSSDSSARASQGAAELLEMLLRRAGEERQADGLRRRYDGLYVALYNLEQEMRSEGRTETHAPLRRVSHARAHRAYAIRHGAPLIHDSGEIENIVALVTDPEATTWLKVKRLVGDSEGFG